jgi:hypothetical protein
MKNLFIYIPALFLFGMTVRAQIPPVTMISISNNSQMNPYADEPRAVSKRKVPVNIQESFHRNFSDIKKAKWRIEERDLYAADFIDANKENVSAYFNSEGVLMEISILKNIHNVSAQLLQQINAQFNNAEVEEIIEVRDYFNDEIFYVVNTFENEEIVEHHLDKAGNLIDKEEEEAKTGNDKKEL